MAAAGKLTMIGIIAISFIAGIISYYFLSELSKEQKKKQIDEVISQLINFILFMILGKVIINWEIFISDPLAVLAYPSNSAAFYFAFFLSSMVLVYKAKFKKMDITSFLGAFFHVFLTAAFLYEFIQLIWKNNSLNFGYLVVISILLVLVLFLRERLSIYQLNLMAVAGWSAGVLGLSLYQPFITVFGYIVSPWFAAILLSACLFFIVNKKRKRLPH